MKAVLDTCQVIEDDDTGIVSQIRFAIPYAMICGPIQDASYLWPAFKHVTAFQDEFGERYHVLEPFQKVLDNWLLALEQEAHKPISFSQQ